MSVGLCLPDQQPFGVGVSNSATALQGGDGFPGSTPADSCRKFAAGATQSFVSATENTCQISGSTAQFPIVQLCAATTPSPFVLSVADGAVLSGLIVSVWISALIFRAFIKAVNPPDGD